MSLMSSSWSLSTLRGSGVKLGSNVRCAVGELNFPQVHSEEGGVVVRVADNLQTTISAQPDYSFRQQHGVWPWCFFVVQNKRFSLTLCSGRGDRTPIRINVLRGLLFLDEAYEKMACIYCQGNPSLTLIRELLIVIGPTLQWLKQLFWNRFTQRREYQIRWEEAARAHLSWIRNVLLVAGRDHSL